MQIINHPDIPKANGHYSMCIEHNDTLYLSGQLPLIAGTKECPEGIEAQTLLVLEKVAKILTAAGSDKSKVISMRLYISDIDLWPRVNAVYAEFFGTHKPVRAVIPTSALHYGCLIEVEAIAAK